MTLTDEPLARAGGLSDAAVGRGLFKRQWVPAPSSTRANDGLGPLFNARSCAQCHAAATAGRLDIARDGRLAERGGVVRLGGKNDEPDPVYGAQVQTNAIPGHRPEAEVIVTWRETTVPLAGGEAATLRQPQIAFTNTSYGPRAAEVAASLLLAPSLAVAGQIARVAFDRLPPPALLGTRVHAFGRKGTEATLAKATAMAFSRDLGLSTGEHPDVAGDCTARQPQCLAGPHGAAKGQAEMAPEIVQAIAAYVTALPAPSAPNAANETGRDVFTVIGCAACHVPNVPSVSGVADVTIFSDLALHDLGSDLAGTTGGDGRAPTQWRTAPLLGLAERLAAGATLLHDGRARTVREAVLWHGGEAQGARDAYQALQPSQRSALEAYIMGR